MLPKALEGGRGEPVAEGIVISILARQAHRQQNACLTPILDLGDLRAARAHFKRALAIFQSFLGDDHPHTVMVRKSLASLGH